MRFSINRDDQSWRATHSCSGNATFKANNRLNTGCPLTLCAQAHASHTVSLIKRLKLYFYLWTRIPVELISSCPFRDTGYSKPPVVIQKKPLGLQVSDEQILRGKEHIPELCSHWHGCRTRGQLLSALSSNLSKIPSALLHKTSTGQRSYSPRKSCWGNFFFLRTAATYRNS